ncbi:MAG: AAA family ATPase [Bacteroidetes bacterium]|nr:AAA family ATPase [Bacteroidota bacterium]MBL7105623.1 AAA family ATPase [Bacteroidales bacterium]
MKLKKIHIKKYKVFRDFDLELTHDGEPLDLVVIAGINGSGKTTLFEFIYGFIHGNKFPGCKVDLLYNKEKNIRGFFGGIPLVFSSDLRNNLYYLETSTYNKNEAKKQIAEYIDKLIYEGDIKSSQAYQKVQKILNSFFDGFDLQIEFNGLDKKREVYFKNEYSEKISISELSTGEQELITKAFTLYLADIKDSVILIDEPETSLHPNWQNKIIKVYEDFAKANNNQVIIATHSPHIVGSAPKESIRVLIKNEDTIDVISDFDGSYGWEIQKVLLEIMGSESLRTPDIEVKISELKSLLFDNKYENQEFIKLMNELVNVLGFNDPDLSLIRLEMAKRKSGK